MGLSSHQQIGHTQMRLRSFFFLSDASRFGAQLVVFCCFSVSMLLFDTSGCPGVPVRCFSRILVFFYQSFYP